MSIKLPKTISKDDATKLMDQINRKCPTGCRNYAILMMMYRSGLRVSEVCNVALKDLDFESSTIYVQSGKGDKDRYTVLDDATAEACKEWIKKRPESNYLFCTIKGGQLDTHYIREVCYRMSERAGVYIQDGTEKKKVSPHKLRHSFATRALNELDLNIREVQELLGHASLNNTMIYTHVNPKQLAQKYRERSV